MWRKIKHKNGKDGILKRHGDSQNQAASIASVKKYLRRQGKGFCSIAANGRALELLLRHPQTDVHKLLLRNLGSLSIIARATPETKKQVIDALRALGGRRIMMCGEIRCDI